MSKHTPTPWEAGHSVNPKQKAGRITHFACGISHMDGGLPDFAATAVGQSRERARANAEHIVTCVNAHEVLKAFAERFMDEPCAVLPDGARFVCNCEPCAARAALKMVEGK